MLVFRSVRARLLALMTLIVIPVAILSVILASTTYRSVISSIEAAQLQTTSNFAVRARVWFRGALRTVIVATASVQAIEGSNAQCERIARQIVTGIEGYRALRIKLLSGTQCSYSRDPQLTAERLDAISLSQSRFNAGASLTNVVRNSPRSSVVATARRARMAVVRVYPSVVGESAKAFASFLSAPRRPSHTILMRKLTNSAFEA